MMEKLKLIGLILYLGTVMLLNTNYTLIISSSLILIYYTVSRLKYQKYFLYFKFSYFLFSLIILLSTFQLFFKNDLLKLGLELLLIINILTPVLLTLKRTELSKSLMFNNSINHILFAFILISTINN